MRHNRRRLITVIFAATLLVCGSVALSYQYFISANTKSQSINRMEEAEESVANAVAGLVDEEAIVTAPKPASEKKLLQEFLRYYSVLVQSDENKNVDPYLTAIARLQMARIETSLGNLKVADRLLRTLIRDLREGGCIV